MNIHTHMFGFHPGENRLLHFAAPGGAETPQENEAVPAGAPETVDSPEAAHDAADVRIVRADEGIVRRANELRAQQENLQALGTGAADLQEGTAQLRSVLSRISGATKGAGTEAAEGSLTRMAGDYVSDLTRNASDAARTYVEKPLGEISTGAKAKLQKVEGELSDMRTEQMQAKEKADANLQAIDGQPDMAAQIDAQVTQDLDNAVAAMDAENNAQIPVMPDANPDAAADLPAPQAEPMTEMADAQEGAGDTQKSTLVAMDSPLPGENPAENADPVKAEREKFTKQSEEFRKTLTPDEQTHWDILSTKILSISDETLATALEMGGGGLMDMTMNARAPQNEKEQKAMDEIRAMSEDMTADDATLLEKFGEFSKNNEEIAAGPEKGTNAERINNELTDIVKKMEKAEGFEQLGYLLEALGKLMEYLTAALDGSLHDKPSDQTDTPAPGAPESGEKPVGKEVAERAKESGNPDIQQNVAEVKKEKQEELDRNKEQIGKLDTDIKSVKDKNNTLITEKSALEQQVNNLQGEDHSEDQIKSLRTQLEAINTQIEANTKAIESLDTQRDDLTAKNKTLEESIKELDAMGNDVSSVMDQVKKIMEIFKGDKPEVSFTIGADGNIDVAIKGIPAEAPLPKGMTRDADGTVRMTTKPTTAAPEKEEPKAAEASAAEPAPAAEAPAAVGDAPAPVAPEAPVILKQNAEGQGELGVPVDGKWHTTAEAGPNANEGWSYRAGPDGNIVATDGSTLQILKNGKWEKTSNPQVMKEYEIQRADSVPADGEWHPSTDVVNGKKGWEYKKENGETTARMTSSKAKVYKFAADAGNWISA